MNTKYTIGYAKPPQKHQFQKGKSGNPKGRPKSKPVMDFQNALVNELKSTMALTEGGQKKIVSRMEVLLKSCLAHAIKGDKGMMKLLLDAAKTLPKEAFIDKDEIEKQKKAFEALETFVKEVDEWEQMQKNEGRSEQNPNV